MKKIKIVFLSLIVLILLIDIFLFIFLRNDKNEYNYTEINSKELINILEKKDGIIFICENNNEDCLNYSISLNNIQKNYPNEEIKFININNISNYQMKKITAYLEKDLPKNIDESYIPYPYLIFVRNGMIIGVNKDITNKEAINNLFIKYENKNYTDR